MSKLSVNEKKLLKSKKPENIIHMVNSLIELKTDIVKNLLSVLSDTEDNELRKFIALAIVDNFKDDRIIPNLKELIKKDSLKNNNAILVYALGEYSNDSSLLDFLVDLILNFDYHVAWNALSIIKSMDANFEESIIENLILKVNAFEINDRSKEDLTHNLKFFLMNHKKACE